MASAHASYKQLGRIGVWATEMRFADPGFIADAAAELDELGYGTIWFPGGRGGDVLGAVDRLLGATHRATIATGILNIWAHEPFELGNWWRATSPDRRDRVLFGLGVGHASVIGESYRQPLKKMNSFLDGLDCEPIPAAQRCIAALGPGMLDLARARSAGAHPYLITPEHTAIARLQLGPDALLAPEQGVIFERDPSAARYKARAQLETYATLPNYRNSWMRLGFTGTDIDEVSDFLVDSLFAWGSIDAIADRVAAHITAGANHVCIQVVGGAPGANDLSSLRQNWRDLAARLSLS